MVSNAGSPGDLTPIQLEILHTVRRLAQHNGHSPCMREVLAVVALNSTSALSYQYRVLRAKGYLRAKAKQPRTVEVRLPGEPTFPSEGGWPEHAQETDARSVDARSDKVIWVPIVGRIAAGSPILAEESIEGYFPMPTDVVGREDGLFILEVIGDSMTGIGIFSHDWVVVRPLFQPPQSGEIVAAIINAVEPEATVKTYKEVDGLVWLMPQNPAHTPIPGNQATIAGKVVAVLRRIQRQVG